MSKGVQKNSKNELSLIIGMLNLCF